MNNDTNYREIYDLLKKLCQNLAPKNHKTILKHITQFISSNNQAFNRNLPYDETTLISRISNHLSSSRMQSDITLFLSINEQLTSSMDCHLRNSILTFLFCMASTKSSSLANINEVFITSSNTLNDLPFNVLTKNPSATTVASVTCRVSDSNHASMSYLLPSQNQQYRQTIQQKAATKDQTMYRNPPLSTSSSGEQNLKSVQTYKIHNTTENNIVDIKNQHQIQSRQIISADIIDELVQDVIYAFTGIQGKYLKKDIITGSFKLDQKARKLDAIQAGMLLRLSELGYYHDLVQSFTDSKSGKCPLGLFGQGMVTALKQELTQYYGMIAVLQEQLNRQRNQLDNALTTLSTSTLSLHNNRVTLLKVSVWADEPMHRLQWLTNIAEMCQERKGGALASTIFNFLSNGDTSVRLLVKELLIAVCGPLQYMLSKWLLEGEINDPYSEFFIEILPEVTVDRLWNDKYRVRESMLPSFISKELANKILVTGKSINFLREVCEDKTPIKGREELKKCFESNIESLFALVPDTTLHMMIDTIYLNTSKKVLDIVMGKHKLLEHLQAMRKYLLLGQGDFIGLLMENLKPELDRPAKELYSYELSSILDVAIRSTNAQYDDPEILKNLDVRLMSNFDGDYGWDIFTLQYTVRGPLSTMLEPSMSKYKLLFKPLWRMKHLEFVLSSKIWKEQMCNAKLLRPLQKELNPITYRLNLYTSEMIHFIHQMQYYILFEIIECSWTHMLEKVQQAKALDDILEAHNQFLKSVKIGAFFDDNDLIYGRLEAVFNVSIKLEIWQDKFYEICFRELNARKAERDLIAESEIKGKYGVTNDQRLKRDEELKIFEQSLINYQKSLEKIGEDYEYEVRQFLLMLTSNSDHNLQLFGIRLDFNEYYKKRDQRLDVPLTFERMRMSSMFCHNKSVSRFN